MHFSFIIVCACVMGWGKPKVLVLQVPTADQRDLEYQVDGTVSAPIESALHRMRIWAKNAKPG